MRDLNPVDNYLHGSWEALGSGAPMLVALAQLASENWTKSSSSESQQIVSGLSREALAILVTASRHGMIEIKAVNAAFEASARMLAVYVELDEDETLAFRDPENPSFTMAFLEGFRELCAAGYIMHHTARDFSVTPAAIAFAGTLDTDDLQPLIDQAIQFGLHSD